MTILRGCRAIEVLDSGVCAVDTDGKSVQFVAGTVVAASGLQAPATPELESAAVLSIPFGRPRRRLTFTIHKSQGTTSAPH